MLSHNNWEEQIKKYEPKQQRFTIKKLSVGVASVLLGVTFAAGTASADSTTANADSASGSDSAEQTDHNLTLNSASTSTLKSATAENQSNNASAAVQNPAGDIKAQAANDYEAAVSAAVANASSEVASDAAQNSASAVQNSAAQNTSATSSSAQASAASAIATQSFTVSSSAVNNNLNYASVFASLAAMPQANTAAQSSATNATANNDEYSGYKTVTDWNGLQSAALSGAQGVNIKGNITPGWFGNSDLNINGNFTIHGVDGAVLNLGQNKINNNGQLTLADVTVNGSIMGNGTVNIKGAVTSNVNSLNSSVPTQDQYNAQNYTGSRTNFKNSNIAASRVNIENGASLTINSSEINDGINLADGGTVKVGDNATLNVNLTNSSTTATRYHVAGVFAKNGGNFISGYKSNVNFNTGLGQAIAIGATRPTVTDSDRFGGYGARSRNDGPTLVQLGDSSTFNFTGRDGIILGNNANFISGENSNVHFENKGRGVALDLANNSNIEISKHSTTYFHSVGKTGTSGSYDGYNYIGVNEGGNITVDEYATFRVILEGRGDNPWDDVISLDSRNANTNAAFTSKTGAIVDIRDDNTNFYAELISFPLGSANSRIDIQDPLMLNLQRYSNGGATTGWMATGGDMINTTSSQYTSNLIYMSGSKGVFSVSGGDYDPSNPNSSGFVVYQQIKSDGSKQIWLNVNSVDIPMNGFQTKDIWNNQANPDVSIAGNGLTAGIKANQVHNFDGSPLTGSNAPYYGISTQRASHQIWIPHRTPLEITGNHTNTIKYVDEQGNEIFPENTASLNLKRNIILDITQEQIKKIQDYALNHTADETLEYIKNSQSVAQDSGWKFTNGSGQTVTDPYATVESPKLDGYTATIQSTNVQGLKVGEDGSSVTAKFAIDPSEDIVQNGELSDSYKNNGITGIPDNYVTVVVYKHVEKGSVKVVYHDDTTNTDIPNTEYNTGSVDAGTKVDYKTSTTIQGLEKQGYVYVSTDGTIPAEIEGNKDVTVTVHMKHGVQPVTPDTPDVPKTPDGKTVVDPANLTKDVNLTVNYVNSDGTQFTGTIPSNAKQTVTFTGNAYVDKVTGQLVNATQQDGKWIVDTNNTATPQITWTAKDGKTSFEGVISPSETGYHVANVSSHADGNNVAQIDGLTKDSQDITITVTYDKDVAKQGAINVTFHDTTNNVDIPGYGNQSGQEDVGTSYTYNPQNDIKALEDKGYVVDGIVPTIPTEITEGTQNIVINMKHGTKPVDPDNPTDKYTKSDLQKQATRTINYVDNNGNKIADSETSTVIFTGSGTIDTVTGNLVNLNPDRSIKDQNGQLTWTYSVDGGAAQNGSSYTFEATAARPTITYNGSDYNFTSVNPGNYNAGNGAVSSYLVNNQDPQNLTVDVIYNKQATYHAGKTETKEVTRTINYLDGKTGEKIPSGLIQNNPVSQTVNMHRTEIVDNNGKVIGYGTVSADGKSYTINNDYVVDGNWASVTSPDLTANGYKAPRFENGSSAAEVAAQTVDQNTTNTTVNVYYDHNEIPVGPDTPNKHGVDPNELTKNVKETVHYVGAGDKTPADSVQNSKWTRTVTVDAVTNEIIPNGQYTTDWTIPDGQKTTYDQVNTPVVEGYYADQANVPATAVTQDDIEKTVTYKPVGNVVPVDPNGNPIPGVPSTPFPNDPTDPTKTTPGTKPTVPGYHPETGKPGDPVDPVPGNPGEDVKVPYVKDQGAVQVIYHDDTTNTTIPGVGYNSGDLDAGTKVEYTTTSTIADLEKQGYVYVSTDGTIPAEIPANDSITVTVHMKHGVQPVTPDTPTPDVPKNTPAEARPDRLTKKVNLTVNYVNADGTTFTGTIPANAKQTATFTGTAYVDKVTGQLVNAKQEDGKWVIDTDDTAAPQITWTSDKTSFDSVTSPAEKGYHVTNVSAHKDGNNVAAITGLTKDSSDITVTVTYAKNGTKIENQQTIHTKATVHYEGAGDQTPADNVQDGFTFEYTGDTYDAETGDKLSDGTWNATSHAYNAVTVPTINGYHTEISVVPSSDLTVTQDKPEVTVTVKYVKNGEEVVNKQNLPASQTVKYVDEDGNALRPEKKQTAEFIYSGDTKDSVTGQITKQGSWNETNHSFTAEDVPRIDGYVAVSGYTNEGGQYVAGGFNAANTGSDADRNKVFTVVYKKVGKIIPVGPDGKTPIPDAPTPNYPNDPTNPTDVKPNEPVPDVPGYRPTVPTVTPDKPTEDTPVIYNQVQKADLTIVDQDNNNQQIIVDGVTTKFNADGIKDENIVFTGTEAAQAALEARGYEFVSSNFTSGTKFDDDANTDQHFVIVMKHGQQPVTPTNPGKPGEPINPNDPDGPKYPDGSDQVTKDVTRTIQYVDENGDTVSSSVEQPVHFTAQGVLDKVTGQWITPLTWSGSQAVASVKSPVIAGYHLVNVDRDAAGNDVAGVTLTHSDNSYTVTVKYAKNGKIIPVDPTGKPIPDVPQPQYPTDPTDPTKVTPNEPVPTIPGYTPEIPTVTPDKPGEDTPVVYHQDVQATVNYIDDVTGQTLKTDTLQGVEGNKSDYSTKGSIANYESQGYKLVSDGFPADGYTFATGEHVFNVHLTHSTSPVDPDHPGAGYSATDLKKTVTRTINYLDGQGNIVANQVSQSFDFIANGTVDNVTHKLVTVENGKITGDGQLTWNAAKHDFDAVVSPTVKGMHVANVTPADQKAGDNVAKTTINNQSGNIVVNVYYAPNGTHQDGAKTVPSTQTVTFVDEDGNELHAPAVSDFTFSRTPDVTDPEGNVTEGSWNATSHTYGTVNVPVIPGYVAEVTTAGGKTATIDNPNVTDKVVYKKVGKIIPVDPTGKPIPDTPTPSYPNDPTDPTKVTPDEPVPSIPGYTPDTPTVTPDKPTTDTPVTYRQNVQATVTYIDDVTGSTLKTDTLTGLDGKPSDYSTKGSIANYESQGYKLVSDDFPADGYTFSTTGTHSFTVHLTHGTEPVNPEHPGAGYDKTDLQKEVTRTIHFVNTQNGNQVADPVSETVNFTANGTVDKVTGKLVTVENGKITGPGQLTWTPAQDVKAVESPAITGMHVTYVSRDADGTNVKGVSLTHNDSSYDVYVNYAPNGTTTEHGQNIPASQTIKFVDENGTTLRENNVQTSEFTRTPDVVDSVTGKIITEGVWNETSHKFGTINVPVIDGYVAEVTTAGGLTATAENPNVVTEVVYKKVGKIIPVDPTGNPIPNAPTPGYPNDPTDPTKVTPDEPVPTIPGYTPEVPTVTPSVPTEDTPVVYHPVDNTQNAQVRYIDLTNNEELANSGNLSGQPGDKINYSTADEIKNLEDKGYVLVNDGFPTDAAFDNNKDHDQVFTVTFRHGTQPVTPTNPGKPGEPINPNDPDGPKYPDGSDQVTKDVTRTVQYVDENGNKVSESVEQTVNFTAQGVLDKVTGQWITPLTWSGSQSVVGVKTPVVEGYHVVNVDRDGNGNNVAGVTLTHENDSYTVTVKYAKNGKIIPVDPSGKPIPNVPTPQYPTDPTDPSKVTPDEPVPTIPGYTPSVPTVTPTDPGKDTPVPYNPIVNDQTAVVNYVDQDNNNAQIATSGNLTGKPGSVINYSTADQIKQLENQGYVLVSDGFPAGATFDDDDNTTQTYTVVLKHGQQPVTPTNPGKPGEPINPNDPDGPKYPDGSDQVTKDVTRTIQYVDENGNKVSEPVEQTAHFTGEGVLDKVTGQWITPITWTGNGNLTGEKTPVVEGYHVVRVSRDSNDNVNVDGTTVNYETADYTVTVSYAKNGKIVPVDPSGKPIPNVPTPQYPTDPTDPSKVTPDEPVPTIPGYTPSVPTVTPTDPGKDTPVPYTPIVNDQTAVVNYVDQDNNNAQIATSGNLTGKPGSVINYSTADQIKQLEDQGYVLVSDGFPAGAVFDNDDNTTQTYTVVLKHGTTTFKPDKPGTPGEPINPNYPDGPKVTNEDVDYLKDVKFTVHYVGAGNDNPADNVQNAQWTRSITVDNVTGKIISSTEWVSNKGSYDGVKTPVVNGYHADRAQVDGSSVTMEDQEATVTYVPNGKIIPVDPTGNPIPDVPTPQYPTDPTDPTKVTPDEPVPTIPGYKPEVPTVTPTDPGVDTPVKYTPDTVNPKPAVDQIAIVNYVDQDNNNVQIATSGDLTGKAGSVINYSTADQIKQLEAQGYVLVSDGFPAGATFDDNADQTQVFTVVLKHGHAPVGPNNPHEPGTPVNPDEPNGPKWPAKDTYTKEYTSTVHFVDNNGNKMRDDDVQTSTWTRTLIIDKVTGQVINPEEGWTADKGSYNEVKVPVINGYVADKANVPAKETVQQNLEDTVTYTKVGNIVPVDPNGNPIPNVPAVPYTNDPTDPTKVVPNEPVPSVP
ncbi:YSIRK-type signal peptide-containing protein, partial [Limosilactobacillus reuteri]|uniref:mucin-binding protein n=4 Tax=Limosilactobacillus reuteri TaxID=1598 RepID=UPI001E5209AF